MKQKLKTNQQGIAHLGLLLLVLIVIGAVGGGAYYVYQNNQDQETASSNQAQEIEDEIPDDSESEAEPTEEVNSDEPITDDDGNQE